MARLANPTLDASGHAFDKRGLGECDADACIETIWQDHRQIMEWVDSSNDASKEESKKAVRGEDPLERIRGNESLLPLNLEHFDANAGSRNLQEGIHFNH